MTLVWRLLIVNTKWLLVALSSMGIDVLFFSTEVEFFALIYTVFSSD